MNEIIDVFIRSVVIYLFIIVAIRITGKKQLSQLNTFDVVLILLISNAVQNAMVGNSTSLLGGVTAASTLFLMNYIFKLMLYKSNKFKKLLNDKPQILIHNGKLDFDKLARLRITDDEIREAMREHGVESFKEVKWAILEVDGNISIISIDKNPRVTQYKRKHQHKTLGMID